MTEQCVQWDRVIFDAIASKAPTDEVSIVTTRSEVARLISYRLAQTYGFSKTVTDDVKAKFVQQCLDSGEFDITEHHVTDAYGTTVFVDTDLATSEEALYKVFRLLGSDCSQQPKIRHTFEEVYSAMIA